jgi:ABC-type transport system involved in multi-copper enzyme maturation permease subunit
MTHLLFVEMRRALHRRVVWGLLALALALTALAGVIAFVSSTNLDAQRARGGTSAADAEGHPALLANWVIGSDGDSPIEVGALALILGGLIGGASVAGAEWKAGTITTVLTWEPRRHRLHAMRTASAGLLACAIAVMLQLVFLGAFLPAVLVNGSTSGADGDWFVAVGAAVLRVAAVTACSAVLGVALSTIGRNTAFGIVTAWIWLAVVEGILRGLRPQWTRGLLGESATTVLQWSPIEGDHPAASPSMALVVALAYVAVLYVASLSSFMRRDIAG